MSPTSPVWTVAGALVATVAAVLLVRQARSAGTALRWLAAAAVAWGAAFIAQVGSTDTVTPAAVQLSLGDLFGLFGLPPLVIGLVRLAAGSWPREGQRGLGVSWIADGALLSLSAFAVGWIVLLRPAYLAADVGAGSFTVALIHPLADLAVLGGALAAVLRAGRRGLFAYLALVAGTLGDLMAVQAHATGGHPGSLSQLAWLVALLALGACALPAPLLAGLPGSAGAGGRRYLGSRAATVRRTWSARPGTVIALTAAATGSVFSFFFAVLTWGHSGPVPLIAACTLMFAVVARAVGLLLQLTSAAQLAELSGSKFVLLAERTSDVVLLCDGTGVVTYASGAVAEYGYEPARLVGQRLADLVHPDDRGKAARAVASATGPGSVSVAGVACQVRAADGTWRDVQATVSRYAGDGGAILITARDLSDQVALRRQVTHLTFHDGLTGLPNRAYLEERAKDLLARGAVDGPERCGAIFIDLDGFTAINDSVGHGAGDLLLAQVGRRLRGLVAAHDTVARWGGDEFALLIEQAARPQEIVDIADRLAAAITAEPFAVADRDVPITAAVGVAFADPDVGEHLLRNADLAMAMAKEAGGNRVEVFAAHMHADVIRRLELAADLREAIADGGLEVVYQPFVELATSRVTGVEALLRWRRGHEQVPAAELLDIAEDSGLIVALGDWVLQQASQQVARWSAAGWQVGLSVNFSFRQISAARFAESVLTALDDAGLPRSALTMEVTERELIEAGGQMISELARLRRLGVRLAIDDFGTGYASLAYLRELPVDIIKIDPSFVAGLGSDGTLAMLTRTIVQVGHDLGIEIVAEGIERPEQLELLRAMGCGVGQGFLLARPMPAAGIESLPGGPGSSDGGDAAATGEPSAPATAPAG